MVQIDQVNAWASYDKTAKQARTLYHGRRERQQYDQPGKKEDTSHQKSPSANFSVQSECRETSNLRRRFKKKNDRHQTLYSSHKNVLNMSRHDRVAMTLSRHNTTIDIPMMTMNDLSTSKHGASHSIDEMEALSSDTLSVLDASPAGFFETLVVEKRKSVSASPSFGEKEEKCAGKDHDVAPSLDDETLAAVREVFSIFFDDPLIQENDETFGIKSFFSAINATMPWQYDSLHSSFTKFIGICLRGIGQVYFTNNPVSGLLIMVATFVQSTRVAIHGIIALVCGTAVALFLGFDKGLARSGLFGYNAYLVGLAIATFDSTQPHSSYSAATLISTVVISSFSSVIFVMLGKLLVPYESPPLTLPFNLVTILFLAASANMDHVSIPPVNTPALPDYESRSFDGITARAFFAGVIRGVGQVFLADDIVSGVLVLLGITVCSRISAMAALLGSMLGGATALAIGIPASAIEQGMFGFNASLSVTAMFMFYTPSIGAGVLAMLSGFITVICQQALATSLEPLGLPYMTLPFCLVGLPFIIIQGTSDIVIAVPLSSITIPEDHFQIVKMLEDGFAFLKECLMDSEESVGGRSFTQTRSRKMTKSLKQLSSALLEFDQDKDDRKSKQCWCYQERGPDAAIKASALSLYKKISKRANGPIPMQDFMQILQEAGLIDREGLNFAHLMLVLIDVDHSLTIDQNEFVAFAVVCTSVDTIRQKLLKFFAFVDEDGNGKIDFEEMNHALKYLCYPSLTQKESHKLSTLAQCDEDGIDVIELLNVVTATKVQSLINAYHCGQSYCGQSSHDLTNKEDTSNLGIRGESFGKDDNPV